MSPQWTELTYKGTTYIWQKRVTMVEMMKVQSGARCGWAHRDDVIKWILCPWR
jgi:hypothetical protein